ELLRFGGAVMKNVAGFDVSRLLCGSLGVLGLIAEVTLKVLPRPRLEQTLVLELGAAQALALFNRNRGQPLPVSAQAWHGGRAAVRLSGAASAVAAARARLGGELLDDTAAETLWRELRDHAHPLLAPASAPLWRLSVPPTVPLESAGAALVDWGGALRWLRSDEPAQALRERIAALGGSAMRWHGNRAAAPMFQPLDPVNLELHRRLKQRFDPQGIFNPGRLVAGL
ncbi:MAG: glycolate oxidase subunit GlcE, partial [Nevskia sp.]|nr:glycolate oxidase subunit GlcE [Nevskia sp.]